MKNYLQASCLYIWNGKFNTKRRSRQAKTEQERKLKDLLSSRRNDEATGHNEVRRTCSESNDPLVSLMEDQTKYGNLVYQLARQEKIGLWI